MRSKYNKGQIQLMLRHDSETELTESKIEHGQRGIKINIYLNPWLITANVSYSHLFYMVHVLLILFVYIHVFTYSRCPG